MKNEANSHRTPFDPAGDSDQSPTLDWVVFNGRVDHVFDEVAARLGRRHRRRMGTVAASLAAMLMGTFAWQTLHVTSDARSVAPVSAVVLLPAKQLLPDGSVVELKDGANITVEFTDAVRRVVLQRGEGHFEVTKNAERPFVVIAAGVEVRAVGTAFSVQLGNRAVEVLVTEGSVAVDRPAIGTAAPSGPPTEAAVTSPPAVSSASTVVEAGNRVVIDIDRQLGLTTPPVVAVSEEELNDRLAWRIPRLEFAGTPLAQAIPMFNQHGRVRLVLGDRALGSLELSGVMRADNTDSLLRLLHDEFGIKAERRGDELVLRR